MSLQKKIEAARKQGQIEGVTFGMNKAFDIIEQALQRTPGIGEKRQAAIMQTVKNMANELKEAKRNG
jgi:hypothetical protein